ncbi:MAG: RDD family protein [Terracidiphilus sp.]
MSKSASTATLFPSWKEEVNRRVAAHLSQKTASVGETKPQQEGRPAPASRAARAAARVAERYAHAPSYSEILAGEARAAVRAAQAASRAAQEAHAAVQYVLAGLEAAAGDPAWDTDTPSDPAPHRPARPAAAPESPGDPVHFDEDMHLSARVATAQPAGRTEAGPAIWGEQEAHPVILDAAVAAEGFEPALRAPVPHEDEPFHQVDPAQPIYGNLIQFPREMVATRKIRPRRAEGPLAAAEPEAQLSIFEIDPATISTQPAVVAEEPAAPAWMRTELVSAVFEPEPMEDLLEKPEPQAAPAPLELAPPSRRLLAHVVDASLIVAAFLGAATAVGAHAGSLPGPRAAALGSAIALLIIGAAYQILFVTLTGETPGMRYAGIGFSTFSGDRPNNAQLCGRLMALLLSAAPVGLGLAWALFDEGGLTWHDRLSKTYLRKR